MALLHCESFDLTNDVDEMIRAGNVYTVDSTPSQLVTSNARNNRSMRHSSPAHLLTTLPITHAGTTLITGFAVRFGQVTTRARFMRVLSGTTIHLSLYVTAASRLEIALDTTTIATGSTTTFLINTWYYIELKTVIGNAGSYEVRIDGVTELSSGSADTQNGGTADWNAVVLGGFNNGIADIMYDDWYICDNDNSDGLDNDDFLGDCIVEGVLASTGNGTNADSTPSTGTDRGALVDELPANEDTDYNTLAAVADTDTYNFAALTATGTVRGVRVNAQAKKTDTGVRTVSMVTRTNGTDYTHGDEVPLPTTYGNISQIFAANPDTGNKWTTSEVDNAEFGLTVAT